MRWPSPTAFAAADTHAGRSGAFRTKVNTAKTFGAIDTARDRVTITALGRRIAGDQSRKAALVEAFLHVPLYARIYNNVAPTGGALPDDTGLEALIKQLGVVETQVDRARQALQRSARQAGFFAHGERRLVKPALTSGTGAVDPTPDPPKNEIDGGGEVLTGKPTLIVEVFKKLPSEGKPWPDEDREAWKAALDASLDLIYGSPSDAAKPVRESNGRSS